MSPDADVGKAAPRSLISTSAISLILGPTAGLLWIGYGRLALALIPLGLGLAAIYLWGLYSSQGWAGAVIAVFMHPLWSWLAGAALSLLLVLPFRLRRRPEGWYSRGWGYCLSLLALLLAGAVIAVTLRSFLIQPFSIPSSSMEPTLQPGDHIFANKRVYGVGPYSMPFGPWPLELGRRMPQRGDIVIFRHPDRPGQDYVKRLIGLPGDTITLVGGRVVLNGKPLLLQEENLAEESEPGGSGRIFRETLPDGRSYRIRDIVEGAFGDDAGPFVVPAGQFFALGDNRDNSDDSRFSMGSVPLDNLIGRADVIFWNSEGAPFRERRALAP